MKETIMKLIRHRKVVYDLKGNEVNPLDMKDDTFYCFNKNTLLSDGNIAKWKKFIADNTVKVVTETVTELVIKPVAKKVARKRAPKKKVEK